MMNKGGVMLLCVCGPNDRSRDEGGFHVICLKLQPNLKRLKTPSKVLLHKLSFWETHTSPLFLLQTHLTQLRKHSEIRKRWPLPLRLNPHPIPFEALWHREGMFGVPHPDARGPEGGLFTLFYTLLPRLGVIWVSIWFKPKKWRLEPTSRGVYCTWLQGRGAWVYRDTPISLCWASPDCMNGQTDWRPQSFELYGVCNSKDAHVSL